MFLGDIELPSELLDAQQEGELVIFAGAGVSMACPTCQPGFAELVSKLAENTVQEQRPNERPDEFLGRLRDAGVRVHELTHEILSDVSKEPNCVHRAAIKVFRDRSSLRLVTTNFDDHFRQAADELHFDTLPQIYTAPALPLGDSFSGIVHLHGYVRSSPSDMVLTDRDFGRAYLTEGWARRFLVSLFNRYTVLFIGYGHRDFDINYLARALPPGGQGTRFAIVRTEAGSEEDEYWKSLGVHPILIENHDQLPNTLEAWVAESRRGALDHEQRIGDLVSNPPPLARNDESYLERCLGDIDTLRIFCRAAKLQEWFEWADEKGLLSSLFDPLGPYESEYAVELARWLGTGFVREFPLEALRLVTEKGPIESYELWYWIADSVRKIIHKTEPGIIGGWIALLLSTSKPRYRTDILTQLVERLRFPEDAQSALLILDFLTQPQLKLPIHPLGHYIDLRAEMNEVHSAIEAYFLLNLAELALPILELAAEQLRQLTRNHRAAMASEYITDPVDRRRRTIEPSDQDLGGRSEDILVDLARDAIDALLEHNQSTANSLIELWLMDDVPIVRRLAVYGLWKRADLTAEQKVQFITERHWLFPRWGRHEIYVVLRDCYPRLDPSARSQLIELAEKGPQPDTDNNEQLCYWKILNLLDWLQRADTLCPVAREAYKSISAEIPELKPSSRPDLDVWTEDLVLDDEMLTIIGVPPVDESLYAEFEVRGSASDVHWFLTYGNGTPQRARFLRTIEEFSMESPDWALTLSQELLSTAESDELFATWHFLLKGLARIDDLMEKTPAALETLTNASSAQPEVLDRSMRPIAEICEKIVENSLSTNEWDTCAATLQLAVDLVVKGNCEQLAASLGWGQAAYGHPGGRVARTVITVLRANYPDVRSESVVLAAYELLDQIVDAESSAGVAARIELACNLSFMHRFDGTWVANCFFPLFAWKVDAVRAQQVWQGFLFPPNVYLELETNMLPMYEELVHHISDLEDTAQQTDARRSLAQAILRIFLVDREDKARSRLMRLYLIHAQEQDRELWAIGIGRWLTSLNENDIRIEWEKWLTSYWWNRIMGRPVVLNAREASAMAEWLGSLEPVFPEAVTRVTEGPPLSRPPYRLIRKLEISDIPLSYPDETVRILRYFAENTNKPWDVSCISVAIVVTRMIGIERLHNELRELCDSLARIGCLNASSLASQLAEAAASLD